MTETDVLKRAQEYMLSLARGFDPLTGEEINDDSVINNVRMSRCFFYVADVLGKVIANGGEVSKTTVIKTTAYTMLSDEIINSFPYNDSPMGISNIIKTLREMIGEHGKPLSAVQITAWLLNEGYLIENIRSGKREKVATAKGNALGITVKEGINAQTGIPYRMNLYDTKAQRFILENHNRILAQLQNTEENV
ncbi:MAG: hypothetical protein E7523_08195 [Ruminococcaceae bacterium]|nr:hypothetical protein [Oscillospiraceae bacterium]